MAPIRAGLSKIPPVAGAILAGGESRRFGTDKALAPTPHGPMAEIVVRALRGAALDPVVLVGAAPAVSASLSVPTIPDRLPGEGPLAALGTALTWASGVNRVVVVPCDLPRLNPAAVRALVVAGDNTTPVVARLDGAPHPIIGCWPTSMAGPLNAVLRSGERRMRAALDLMPYVAVDLDERSIADADDPSTLQSLLPAPDRHAERSGE